MPYQVSHTAPADDGYSKPVTHLVEAFGPDVYQRPDYYTGTVDTETMGQLRSARDNPDASLRIYRALPAQYHQINTGDWVSLSRHYAAEHAASEGWPVVYADVPAAHVFTDGNDLAEFGYTGPQLASLPHIREGDALPTPAIQQEPAAEADLDLARAVTAHTAPDGQGTEQRSAAAHDTILDAVRDRQRQSSAARINDLTARVTGQPAAPTVRARESTAHERAVTVQRWDPGPAAHGQAPKRHP